MLYTANPLHHRRTINANNLSINPLSILTRQEAHHARNINRQANSVQWAPCLSVLIHFVIVQLVAAWDVLGADGVVHIGFNATRCHTVDGDFLVAEVYGLLASRLEEEGRENIPIAMQRTKVSIAPLLPE